VEERYLVWAVEALLKSVLMVEQREEGRTASDWEVEGDIKDVRSQIVGDSANDTRAMTAELQLPEWATTTDIAAPFEALGSLYSRTGKIEYAMPLYLQAISILIPPPPHFSSVDDRCRGAQLMTALADLIIREGGQHQIFSKTLHQAELWSMKALEIAMQHSRANQSSSAPNTVCDVAYAVALYNIGALRRISGDDEKAKENFLLSLKLSRAIGMQEGIELGEEALRELDTATTTNDPEK